MKRNWTPKIIDEFRLLTGYTAMSNLDVATAKYKTWWVGCAQ